MHRGSKATITVVIHEPDEAGYPNGLYEFVTDRRSSCRENGRAFSVIEKEKSFMTTIVEKAKFMALPGDDKVLRKQGFVDASGKLTTEGREMLEQVNFDANKKALVDVAKALEAEEKAEKKAS